MNSFKTLIIFILFLSLPVALCKNNEEKMTRKEFQKMMQEEGSKNQLGNVIGYLKDDTAGAMAMHALTSALNSMGVKKDRSYVSGVSGYAFRVVYDRELINEPLRDLYGADYFSNACKAFGVKGKWINNLDLATFKGIVQKSIDENLPLITSYILPDNPKGFSVISGYDFYHYSVLGLPAGPGKLFLQGARDVEDKPGQITYTAIAIPDNWNGPVMSDERWADKPLFVFSGKPEQLNEKQVVVEALKMIVNLVKKNNVSYGYHPSAQTLATPSLDSRQACGGMKALEMFKEDLEKFKPKKDYIYLDKYRFTVEQLSSAREDASVFLMNISHFFKGEIRKKLMKASELCLLTADNAFNLRKVFFCESYPAASLKEFKSKVESSPSIVFKANLSAKDRKKLGKNIYHTATGPLYIDNSGNKKKGYLKLIENIIESESQCMKLLQEVAKDL